MLTHGFVRFWRSRAARVIAVGMACGVVVACHKMPLVAPSGTAIALIATPSVVAANGQAEITAVLVQGALGGDGGDGTPASGVIGGGQPVRNGTIVTFTTSLGRIEPAEVETDNGRATVRLITDGRSGTAVVTAFSGSAAQTLDVVVGAAAAERVAMTAEPQSLPGTGGSSTISARIEEANGNAIAGIPVTFSTTRGTLSNPSSVSNANGVATTVLTTTQEATVTANVGGASWDLAGTITVTLKPRTTVAITPPPSATVGVPVSFTVTPGANAIIENVDLSFGDGQSVSLGAITAATTVSHIFRSAGTKSVTATATDSQGGSGTTSTQVAVAPLALSLLVSPSVAPRGSHVTFSAVPSTGAVIDRYIWNFGDGAGEVVTGSPAVRNYPTAGVRIVSVTAVPFGNGTPATALAQVEITH